MSLRVDTIGSGPPLVLLHGWAMHGGVFAPLVERLSSRFALHLVDLPGHGRSRDSAVPLQLEACVEAIAAQVPRHQKRLHMKQHSDWNVFFNERMVNLFLFSLLPCCYHFSPALLIQIHRSAGPWFKVVSCNLFAIDQSDCKTICHKSPKLFHQIKPQ